MSIWYPYPAHVGYKGILEGNVIWEGDDCTRNVGKHIPIDNEEDAQQIINDLQEAIDEGVYD